MIHRDNGRRAIALGVFLVPLILVKGTAIVMTEPRGASGSTETVVPPRAFPNLTAYSPEWSEEQLAVFRYAEQLRDMPFGPSPLLHGVEEAQHAETTKPTTARPPASVVQAILRSTSGNLARIGRKLFREGDELGDTGWTVESIDAESRSVKIVHAETNTEAILRVPLP